MSAKTIINRFIITEKALKLAEKENKITLVVSLNSTKNDIKRELEKNFNLKVEKVNVIITPKGEKKAMVKLSKEQSAVDFYAKIGLV
ncbi:MAG: 50S ribosomal protein L23 [Thermoproteota archaeon]|jgi:LSU ribosomal protein L23P